jgi:pimeloyl-ACP methyl ester carboxylesterase
MISAKRIGGFWGTWVLFGLLLPGLTLPVFPAPPFPIPRIANPPPEKKESKPPINSATWPDPVEAKFVQVFPSTKPGSAFLRTPGQTRAIVLVHGFHLIPFRKGCANQALFHSWQKPESKLVELLARQGDIYAFAYSQNVAIEEIAGVPCLAENIRSLKKLDYAQIILLGHSAGGLVARQFIEDYPDIGVTKVIQVCSPNGGTNFAHWDPAVSKLQKGFLHSLTKESRSQSLKERAKKNIPESVQFACVVGDGGGIGDGLVSIDSQWPVDLQKQGIPAVFLHTTHFTVMRSPAEAQRLTELVRSNTPRWSQTQVAQVKKEKLGKKGEIPWSR